MCANIQCPTSGLRTVEFACGGGLSTKGTFQVYMLLLFEFFLFIQKGQNMNKLNLILVLK